MDIHPHQTQHHASPSTRSEQPRDLTWLGLADERELLCLAREIAANNQYVDPAGKIFDGIADKLPSWRPVQG